MAIIQKGCVCVCVGGRVYCIKPFITPGLIQKAGITVFQYFQYWGIEVNSQDSLAS